MSCLGRAQPPSSSIKAFMELLLLRSFVHRGKIVQLGAHLSPASLWAVWRKGSVNFHLLSQEQGLSHFDFCSLIYPLMPFEFSSVAQSCPTLCNPMNCSLPGLPVHHQLPEFTQTHVHRVGDAIQPSHPLSSPSLPAPNPSQHQSLFQRVSSSHEVAKVLEFQL